MKLRRLDYSEYQGEDREWKLEGCTFRDVNLLVGRNATGKTRTLNVIRALARQLSEASQTPLSSGRFDTEFTTESETVSYLLEYHQRVIMDETLIINGKTYLKRAAEGKGKIWAEAIQQEIDFQLSPHQPAAYAKRDKIQHPFLEKLYTWGNELRRYDFGLPLGKDRLVLPIAVGQDDVSNATPDPKDAQQVIEIFSKGQKDFGTAFIDTIVGDMNKCGYGLESIGIGVSPDIHIGESGRVLAIYAKEQDIAANIYQTSMSGGMFRALSVLIQVNYSLLAGEPSCILIDDIGEGLDYSRSSALVKLLIDKIRGTSTQLIMATNDRFIMNSVPLEYWIVLVREGGACNPHNYDNSRAVFERFELTGLSNFDFFSSEYYLLGA